MFEPGLNVGQIISNRQLMAIFLCACEGGIRYASKTKTIVLVVNNTKKGLANAWNQGILQFAGRIVKANKKPPAANLRLEEFLKEKGDVFLFEVNEPGKYAYRGKVEAAGQTRWAQTASGERYPVFALAVAV